MPSKRSSADTSLRPRILVDHSLGRLKIPAFFRAQGFETTTILEQFGRTDVIDDDWIQWAGESGVVVAHKDARIRHRPTEIAAVKRYNVRMLCLVNANLTSDQQIEYFQANLAAIERHWTRPGPWILAIRRNSIELLNLD